MTYISTPRVHRTAQISPECKNSAEAMFHTANAGLLSKSAVFALRMYASLWWVVCRVVTGNLTY